MTPFKPVGTQTTISSLSGAQSVTVPANARGLLVQVFTQNVRVTVDGATTPTASVGFQLRPNTDPVEIEASEGSVVKFIEETASATVQYQAIKNA